MPPAVVEAQAVRRLLLAEKGAGDVGALQAGAPVKVVAGAAKALGVAAQAMERGRRGRSMSNGRRSRCAACCCCGDQLHDDLPITIQHAAALFPLSCALSGRKTSGSGARYVGLGVRILCPAAGGELVPLPRPAAPHAKQVGGRHLDDLLQAEVTVWHAVRRWWGRWGRRWGRAHGTGGMRQPLGGLQATVGALRPTGSIMRTQHHAARTPRRAGR